MDAGLAAAIRRRGVATVGWRARTMTGELLYDIADVQAEGLADAPGAGGEATVSHCSGHRIPE
eukprot:15332139-Alexandrium_andersonii.AAC.1